MLVIRETDKYSVYFGVIYFIKYLVTLNSKEISLKENSIRMKTMMSPFALFITLPLLIIFTNVPSLKHYSIITIIKNKASFHSRNMNHQSNFPLK